MPSESGVADPLWDARPAPHALKRATLSHDLQNHLQVVASALNIVERLDLSNDLRIRAALRGATGSLVRVATLARRLGDGGSAQGSDRTFALGPLLAAIADEVALAVGPLVRVDIIGHDLGTIIGCDPVELENAVINLAVNARDAMPRGGRLTLEAYSEFECPAGGNAPRAWAALRVTDTGAGLPPDIVGQVFAPYFSTKGGKGAGLGLASVRDFAERAGGSIDLQSEVGVGTTVLLRLPTQCLD